MDPKLVGGFNPSEKNPRQIGTLPQFSGWKPRKYLKPPPSEDDVLIINIMIFGSVMFKYNFGCVDDTLLFCFK